MAEEFRDMNISDPDDATTGAAVGPSTQPGPISIVESIGTNQKVTAKALVHESLCLEQLAPDYLLLIYQYLSPLDVANASKASQYLSNFAEALINPIFANFRIAAREDDDVCQYGSNYYFKLAWQEKGDRSYICRSKQNEYNYYEIDVILQHIGPHIKRIRFNCDNEYTLDDVSFVVQHCPHLDSLHLENIMVKSYSRNELQGVQCSAKQAILDNVRIIKNVFPKLLPNLTAVSIYRFKDDIRHVVDGVSTLERLTLADGSINFGLFNYLQKHRDTLYSLALINIEFVCSRFTYNGIAAMFLKLEQLQISVASKEDLDALAGMNIKYLQLVAGKQLPDRTTSTGWSLHGLPFLEELDLVEIRVVLDVPSVRVLSTDYSFRVQDHIAKLPNLKCLRMRNFRFISKELDSLFEKNCKETEVELKYPLRQEIPKILEYLHLRFSLKKESPRLVRIIARHQFDIKQYKPDSQPPNVQLASEEYCKQVQTFDPLPKTLRQNANDFDLETSDKILLKIFTVLDNIF